VRNVELDSDIWAVKVDQIVSVTPLSLDMTARVNLGHAGSYLQTKVASCQQVLDSLARLEPCLPHPTGLPAVPLLEEEMQALAVD
jgi:hypothetical protein